MTCQDRSKPHYDSTGKPVKIGDHVRWRGQFYTIKAFRVERHPHYNVPFVDFEQPLHRTDEEPHEFSIDLMEAAP